MAVSDQPHNSVIHRWKIALYEFDEVPAKPDRIQATGHGVCKPKHPSRDETGHTREGTLDKSVTAARLGDGRGQLGVGEGSERGDDSI